MPAFNPVTFRLSILLYAPVFLMVFEKRRIQFMQQISESVSVYTSTFLESWGSPQDPCPIFHQTVLEFLNNPG
jgi:hypothetical protein